LTTDEVWSFLIKQTDGKSQGTKKLRYSFLSSFFNLGKNMIDPELKNPCDTPILRKLFGHPKPRQWVILDKDVVDEMIFRTENPRNRLILELMAGSGMGIGEVLGLRCRDIEDRRAFLIGPKSGKESEVVYTPKKISDRLRAYIMKKGIKPDERFFPITYSAARLIVKNTKQSWPSVKRKNNAGGKSPGAPSCTARPRTQDQGPGKPHRQGISDHALLGWSL
jgi:integrase/recombinase XerD